MTAEHRQLRGRHDPDARGLKHRSIVLQADAKHLMTDVWTSGGVIVAVLLVGWTGWLRLDPLIAMAVAVNIVGASLVLFFLPDPRAALAAWWSALAPGGRLGVSTFGPQDEVWQAVDDVFTPYLPPAMLPSPRTRTMQRPPPSPVGPSSVAATFGGVAHHRRRCAAWSGPGRIVVGSESGSCGFRG